MTLMTLVMAATSFFTGMDPAWIAFLGAAFGGAGLKITEAWLGRKKVKIDDATVIRGEQRQEILDLRQENATLEAERNSWRDKYYALQETMIRYKAALLNNNILPPDDVDPSK